MSQDSTAESLTGTAAFLGCLCGLPLVAAVQKAKVLREEEREGILSVRAQAKQAIDQILAAAATRLAAEHQQELSPPAP